MDVDEFIQAIIGDLRANRLKLPTLPQVAVRINEIIDSPNASTRQVAKVLGTDPALSARLLQTANSPLFRGNRSVDDVHAAVTRLGMVQVRNLVTAFLVSQLFHSRFPALRQRVAVLWSHSVQVAAISHVLALRFTDFKPDEAMLAGLIHDIGKLPIIAKAEKHPELANNPAAMDRLCNRLHGALGKVMVKAWHFPPAFTEVAGEHDDLQRHSSQLDLADIVTVANLHSYTGRHQAQNPHPDPDWGSVPAFAKLGIDPLGSIEALKEAHDEITEIQRLLTA